MTASYPAVIRTSFTIKKNFADNINDYDVNDVQDEIKAIETAIGVLPTQSTINSSSVVYDNAGTNFSSVSARLANIEGGIVGDSHSQYLKLAGGSTITSTAIGTVSATIKAMSGQTAHLLDFRDSSNALGTYVDASGALYAGGALVAGSQDVNNLYVLMMFDQL